MIVLFSDLTMHELKVLPRDLQLCSDMATGVDSLGVFSFGDMVQLDAQTVGVIVQIQKENFQVMYSQIPFHCKGESKISCFKSQLILNIVVTIILTGFEHAWKTCKCKTSSITKKA